MNGGRILSIDPGGTTGFARWHDGNVMMHQVEDPLEAMSFVDNWLKWDRVEPREVVCEDFIPRPGARSWQPDALHIIGVVRYLCWKEGVTSILVPAANKTFATDTRLKAMDMYRGDLPHANDAARHLLKRLVRRKLVNLEELL
jgi:hypothetical protein